MNTVQYDAKQFADFMLAHYKPSRTWADPVGYCAWYIGHGFMATVVREDGQMLAMCAMRPVERPGMGLLPYYFNPDGDCIHIDLLIDTMKDSTAVELFAYLFRERFGKRKTVTMFRHYEQHLLIKDYDKFWRQLTSEKFRKRLKGARQERTYGPAK